MACDPASNAFRAPCFTRVFQPLLLQRLAPEPGTHESERARGVTLQCQYSIWMTPGIYSGMLCYSSRLQTSIVWGLNPTWQSTVEPELLQALPWSCAASHLSPAGYHLPQSAGKKTRVHETRCRTAGA